MPEVLCAATAGATGAFAGNPGDLAMVRMQAPSVDEAHRFHVWFHENQCLQKIYQNHRFLLVSLDFDADGGYWWMF